MSYDFIAIDRHDHIAILRLNRPHNLNSWNVQMRQELRDALTGDLPLTPCETVDPLGKSVLLRSLFACFVHRRTDNRTGA